MRGCSCRGTAGFAHVSCLAEQAKILVEEAEENNLDINRKVQLNRWHSCSLCEQKYHGVVRCALGWACWKTYVGRPETDSTRLYAINQLGNGLSSADHNEDALSVRETQLALVRHLCPTDEESMLTTQSNLAIAYKKVGRLDQATRMRGGVYFGHLKLSGKEHKSTLIAASNFASGLMDLQHFEEAKSLLHKTIPVARRILGESHALTLAMRRNYARALRKDPAATLGDLREAVTALEDLERTARRVLGGTNPFVTGIEHEVEASRAALRRDGYWREETAPGDVSSLREAMEAMMSGDAK